MAEILEYSNVTFSDHACERYIERINPALSAIADVNARLNAARQSLKAVLSDARYAADNKKGVLLVSNTFKAVLVVKDKTIITVLNKRD